MGGDGPSRRQPAGVCASLSDLLEEDCETREVGEKSGRVSGKLRFGLTGGDRSRVLEGNSCMLTNEGEVVPNPITAVSPTEEVAG